LVGVPQRGPELEYFSALRKQAIECGLEHRIRFTGQRRDIPDLLAAADIYCQFNTTPEPFGIALIEALYTGLPVVSSAFGGAAEIITPECGILVPPHDTLQLANALSGLIENPRQKEILSHAGRERALVLCNPVSQIKALSEALNEIIDSRTALSA
jgi:glycosyltransferase involved in cell wall biosynthesis